ncbi:hypothetical protein [Staphylococcus phage SAP6]|nr:hypothetical protein [Staphylococcus phage StAP1]WAW12118.1 hypothetical protein [Staphylococcus phage SAP6]
MDINRVWAMPNSKTFKIKPINNIEMCSQLTLQKELFLKRNGIN